MRDVGRPTSSIFLTSSVNSATPNPLHTGLFPIIRSVQFSGQFSLHKRDIGRNSTSGIIFGVTNELHHPDFLRGHEVGYSY
jgi:hypothetical protein